MNMPRIDRDATRARYQARWEAYGYSPRTLGWDKGKQDVRFDILTSAYDFTGKSVLDIGCGFGDLNRTLAARTGGRYSYHGIDLVPALVAQARALYGRRGVTFAAADFLRARLPRRFDYAIASGVFNFRLGAMDNYDFTAAAMKKALAACRDGLAFDFLSDKVDFRKRDTFHFSPERILSLAYALSRNVVLRNDYMPFEFSIFVFKDDSFAVSDTLFTKYKKDAPR